MPLLIVPSWRIVIPLAPGKAGNQRSIVSSSLSLPASTSWRISVAVKVLVTEPTRVWSPSRGARPLARSATPRTAVQPRSPTHTPAIVPGFHVCRVTDASVRFERSLRARVELALRRRCGSGRGGAAGRGQEGGEAGSGRHGRERDAARAEAGRDGCGGERMRMRRILAAANAPDDGLKSLSRRLLVCQRRGMPIDTPPPVVQQVIVSPRAGPARQQTAAAARRARRARAQRSRRAPQRRLDRRRVRPLRPQPAAARRERQPRPASRAQRADACGRASARRCAARASSSRSPTGTRSRAPAATATPSPAAGSGSRAASSNIRAASGRARSAGRSCARRRAAACARRRAARARRRPPRVARWSAACADPATCGRASGPTGPADTC